MHVVPGEVPCLLNKGWPKQHGAIIDTQAGLLKLTTRDIATSMFQCEGGDNEVDLVSEKIDFRDGRTAAQRSVVLAFSNCAFESAHHQKQCRLSNDRTFSSCRQKVAVQHTGHRGNTYCSTGSGTSLSCFTSSSICHPDVFRKHGMS